MTFLRNVFLLAAAAAVSCLPAAAQTPDAPPAKHEATPKKAHGKAASRKSVKAVPAPETAGRSSIIGSDDAGSGSSLERRRKAFFGSGSEEGETSSGQSRPPVGMTLGGSGGTTPGMGFSF